MLNPIAATRDGSASGRRARNSAAHVLVRDDAGERHAKVHEIASDHVLRVVSSASPVSPVQGVGGEAYVAALREFVADPPTPVRTVHPLPRGLRTFLRHVPRADDLLLADVETGAVVVQEQHCGKRPFPFRHEHIRQDAAVPADV
ncbi:MAG: hypothetical protein ABGY41_16660 [Candidatus Poribacteria bacterium]